MFAVPGEITAALSAGTNDLLRQGATPLLSPQDVLSALGIEAPTRPPPVVSGTAASVLGLLVDGHRPEDYADAIHDKCRRNGLLVSTEGSTVLLLPSLAIDKRTAARGLDMLARSI